MKRFAAITTALLLLFTAASPAMADEHEDAESPQLTVREEEGREVIYIGDEVFTAYNFEDTPRPYLYPIIGPTGAHMTRNYPMLEGVEGESADHPHHRSLWFAHGNVSGVDFWHDRNNAGVIQNSTQGAFRDESAYQDFNANDSWLRHDGTEVADANMRYGFTVLEDDSRVIDVSTDLAPAEGVDEIVFGDTKEGTMAIRLHPALRLRGDVATGHCVNSNGDTDGDCWGKRAAWVAYWGQIDGETCGVAVFDHPTNLRHPTWWHARDYGLVAANPFGIHDFERGQPAGTGDHTVAAGDSLALRYRFVFFAGTAEDADIAGKYARWVEDTTGEIEEAEDE